MATSTDDPEYNIKLKASELSYINSLILKDMVSTEYTSMQDDILTKIEETISTWAK